MPDTTIPSRELTRGAAKAKRAARAGPVFITERGRPTHVLLTIDAYRQLACARAPTIVDLLRFDGDLNDGFEPGTVRLALRPADLS